MEILFVCTGNICRSPMAEAIFEDRLARGYPGLYPLVNAGSAGVAALEGNSVTETAVQAMDLRGIDLSGHRARLLDRRMARGADLIVTMAREHLLSLQRMDKELADKAHTLLFLASCHDEAMRSLGRKTVGGEGELESRLRDLLGWLASERKRSGKGEAEMMASDIIDPIGGTLETYLTVADKIEEALEKVMPMLFGEPEEMP